MAQADINKITSSTTTYTVCKGDTISDIAQRCIDVNMPGYANKPLYWEACDYLAGKDSSLNPDVPIIKDKTGNVNYLIHVGQKIILQGTAAKKTTTAAQRPKITAFGLTSNKTEGSIENVELYATWAWSKSNTDYYQVRWKYATGDGVGWVHTDTKTETNGTEHNTNSRYSKISGIDGNATQVTFQVKPVSKTYKKNDKETHYWTADWSTKQTYWFKDLPPVTPPKPSVSSDDITKPELPTKQPEVTVKLENLAPTEIESSKTFAPYLNAHEIQFQFLKNNKTVFKSGRAKIANGVASYTCKITAGDEFKVRVRSYRGARIGGSESTKYSQTQGVYSDWSEYSTVFGTAPTVISKIDTLYIRDKNSKQIVVRAAWDRMDGDKNEYVVGYTTDPEFFTSNPGSITKTDKLTNDFADVIITEIPEDGALYFALQVSTVLGDSVWSEPTKLSVGSAPNGPTTWSSSSTAMLDDQVVLYWAHQSTDGSPESQARLDIKVTIGSGSKSLIGTIKEDENGNYYIDAYTEKTDERDYIYITKKRDDYGNIIGSTSALALTFPSTSTYFEDGVILEWRVSTAGSYEENDQPVFSDWTNSNWRRIDIYSEPIISLTANGGDLLTDPLDKFPITVNIESETNSEFQKPITYYVSVISVNEYETVDSIGNVKMVKAGEVIYGQHFDTNNTSLEVVLNAGNIDLENGQKYIIKCITSYDSGLNAEAESEFTVEWTDDESWPNLEITYDENTYTTMLKPFCMDVNEYGDEFIAQDVTLSVYRREFDGTFTELATGLNNVDGTYVTDPHPSLDYARYRVVATRNSTGAVSYYDVPGFPIGETSIIIQWDEQWSDYDVNGEFEPDNHAWAGSLLKLPYNVDISESHDPDVELIKYIGRENPVSYHGTQIGHTSTWYTVIPKDDVVTLYTLRRLAKWIDKVYVREPSGTGYWANVKISYSKKHNDLTIPITLTITRVEGE